MKPWETEFMLGWVNSPDEGMKRLLYRQGVATAAMELLDSLEVGEEVAFEGDCPSGTTYEGRCVWDGSPEMRAKIEQKAFRLAPRARIVSTKQRAASIQSARMRTA